MDTAKDRGSVTSFAINSKTGLLTEVNSTSSFGNSPCHINTSPDGNYLFASHYKDGSLTVLSVDKKGKITGLADSVIHRGSSVNKQRQESAHAHSTQFFPETNYIITADLGSDKLWVHKFDQGNLSKPAFMTLESVPGSGPRHFDFTKEKSLIYVAEELSSTVSVFSIDFKQNSAVQLQRISTVPDTFSQPNALADIHFSPDQKFLYVSNRGHNSVAIFMVEHQSGKLTLAGHYSTMGKTPRNFYIDEKGEFVLVANQDSDDIVFFTRDKETGMIKETEVKLKVPSPVCLKMIVGR
jgi:6-phosphogluconolactonase